MRNVLDTVMLSGWKQAIEDLDEVLDDIDFDTEPEYHQLLKDLKSSIKAIVEYHERNN